MSDAELTPAQKARQKREEQRAKMRADIMARKALLQKQRQERAAQQAGGTPTATPAVQPPVVAAASSPPVAAAPAPTAASPGKTDLQAKLREQIEKKKALLLARKRASQELQASPVVVRGPEPAVNVLATPIGSRIPNPEPPATVVEGTRPVSASNSPYDVTFGAHLMVSPANSDGSDSSLPRGSGRTEPVSPVQIALDFDSPQTKDAAAAAAAKQEPKTISLTSVMSVESQKVQTERCLMEVDSVRVELAKSLMDVETVRSQTERSVMELESTATECSKVLMSVESVQVTIEEATAAAAATAPTLLSDQVTMEVENSAVVTERAEMAIESVAVSVKEKAAPKLLSQAAVMDVEPEAASVVVERSTMTVETSSRQLEAVSMEVVSEVVQVEQAAPPAPVEEAQPVIATLAVEEPAETVVAAPAPVAVEQSAEDSQPVIATPPPTTAPAATTTQQAAPPTSASRTPSVQAEIDRIKQRIRVWDVTSPIRQSVTGRSPVTVLSEQQVPKYDVEAATMARPGIGRQGGPGGGAAARGECAAHGAVGSRSATCTRTSRSW